MALGVLLPDSRPLAVSMETPIRWANAGCVTPSLPRMSLISIPKVDDPLLDDFASAAVEKVVPGAAEGVLQPGEGGDGHAGFAFLEAPDGAVVQRRPRNVILNEKF